MSDRSLLEQKYLTLDDQLSMKIDEYNRILKVLSSLLLNIKEIEFRRIQHLEASDIREQLEHNLKDSTYWDIRAREAIGLESDVVSFARAADLSKMYAIQSYVC